MWIMKPVDTKAWLYIEKNLRVSGPTLSKPVLFKGQLYLLNSNYLLFGPGAVLHTDPKIVLCNYTN